MDRLPRRPVLVGVDLVRGLALATVPVAGALGRLTLAHLAVVALAVGMGRVLFDVAYPSYLPALVGRDELVGANAYLETSRSASQLTGPGLGGWLVQTADAATAVLADAVNFLASAGCLLAIRVARGADTARLIWLPVTVTAPFALCTLLTAPGWRVALFPLGVAVTSFGQAPYNIAQVSYRQARCPPELLGRMNASIRFLSSAPCRSVGCWPRPAPAGERS